MKTTDFFVGTNKRKARQYFPNVDCNLKTKVILQSDIYSCFSVDLPNQPVVNITFILNLKVIKIFTYLKEIFYERRGNLKPLDAMYLISVKNKNIPACVAQ